ncbi:MAG: VTT domain-containing protein [Candidatus Pacearchaeota archaeon]|jgi:uncharacterized membrane protein YdjX (TVP38/TMEM64 family)
MRKQKIINILVLIIFILIVVWIVSSYISNGIIYKIINLDSEYIVNILGPYKAWAFVIYFLVMVCEVIFAPIHPFPFYVAGSILFGPFIAGVLACLGGAVGGAIAFKIAKKWGRRYVERIFSKEKIEKFDNFSKKRGGISIFLLRLNPLTSTDAWSYIAGVSKVSFWSFMIWTFLGLIPSTFLQTYLGIPIKNNPWLFKIFMAIVILYLIVALFLIFYSSKKNSK